MLKETQQEEALARHVQILQRVADRLRHEGLRDLDSRIHPQRGIDPHLTRIHIHLPRVAARTYSRRYPSPAQKPVGTCGPATAGNCDSWWWYTSAARNSAAPRIIATRNLRPLRTKSCSSSWLPLSACSAANCRLGLGCSLAIPRRKARARSPTVVASLPGAAIPALVAGHFHCLNEQILAALWVLPHPARDRDVDRPRHVRGARAQHARRQPLRGVLVGQRPAGHF